MKRICALAIVLGAFSLQPAENTASPFPVQLEAVVPYEPTAFPSDGRQRLVYELLLRNFEGRALNLQQLRVLDADVADAQPLAVYDLTDLRKIVQPIGVHPKDQDEITVMPPGGSSMVYLLLTVDAGARLPKHLRNEVTTSAGSVASVAISTQHDELQVLAPPLSGGNWLAETGLSNDNGHRRG